MKDSLSIFVVTLFIGYAMFIGISVSFWFVQSGVNSIISKTKVGQEYNDCLIRNFDYNSSTTPRTFDCGNNPFINII